MLKKILFLFFPAVFYLLAGVILISIGSLFGDFGIPIAILLLIIIGCIVNGIVLYIVYQNVWLPVIINMLALVPIGMFPYIFLMMAISQSFLLEGIDVFLNIIIPIIPIALTFFSSLWAGRKGL